MTFHTTHWTLVRQATVRSTEGRQALSELCAAYYEPVVAFLRREGREEDAARELAHEFFRKLLEKPSLQCADQTHGKFRSYLLGALKHFLARERERAGRQKRGGGAVFASIDSESDNSPEIVLADRHDLPPDEFFDRQWALAVLDRAFNALAKERDLAGKAEDFSRLKPWLTGDASHGDQAATARALGISEGALKVAVHRLRRRFRELLKAEIAQTLDAPEETGEEMRHLFAALGG
jgi:DNA-directed RNA polymerase specialized sigma24 family protein